MDKKKALESLKDALNEIPYLKELRYDYPKYELWRDKVKQIIISGLSQEDYKTFISTNLLVPNINGFTSSETRQNYYLQRLEEYGVNIEKIIQKYEILGLEIRPNAQGDIPKAFIAHGGDSPALRKLESYLEALGVQPLIVEEQPSEGRSITENVDYYARQSDFAIILATKGDVDGKTGGFIPRGNVLMEIGKLQELLKDRIVYLLQAGTKLPTNISDKVRERFTPQSMDNAFIKVAKELKKFGIIKAVKPVK